MLQIETVESRAFSILKKLMKISALADCGLVGGTALSLQYGHRKSIDLDLFSANSFENSNVLDALKREFKNSLVTRTTNPKFGIFCFLNEVKVDLIRHPHPLIRPQKKIEAFAFSPLKISLP